MSLVEKAKGITLMQKNRREVSPDHVELAIAWLKGEVTTKQCEIALSRKGIEGSMAVWLRDGYREGKVKA